MSRLLSDAKRSIGIVVPDKLDATDEEGHGANIATTDKLLMTDYSIGTYNG